MAKASFAPILLLAAALAGVANGHATGTAKSTAAKPAAQPAAAPAAASPFKSEDEKTIYALGLAISRNLVSFNLTDSEVALVQQGLADGVLNHAPLVDIQVYGPKIQALQKSRGASVAAAEKLKGQAFLAKAATEKGAVKTASGIVMTELKAGTGASPKPTDKVKCHYRGTLIDGTVFDSSIDRGEPATFALTGVIPCWTEALQKMKVGGKSRLVCPAETAYGDHGQGPKIKPGATLVFEVELLDIEQ